MKITNLEKLKETSVGLIPKEWDVLSIEDISEVVGGGTPSTVDPGNFKGEIPWITPRDLSGYKERYISKGERNISQKGLRSSNAKLLPANSVLLSTRAPVGYLAIAKNEVSTNQGFHSMIPSNKTDSLFLYYLLKNNVQKLIDHASGSTFQELSGKTLKSLLFAFPKKDEQERIVEVLSSLDDKIELNRKINSNFEKLASALFKKWFIDIGTELPKGWKKGVLADIAYNDRRTISSNEIEKDSFYIGLEHMPRKSIALDEWGIADNLKSNKFQFTRGDILFGKLRPYFHKVGISPINGVCSTDILVLKSKMEYGEPFLLCVVSSGAFINFVSAAAEGTKMPRTDWATMSTYPIIIPSTEPMKQFNELVIPLLEMINENIHQIRKLEAIRDSLLPRLMSGKIRI